MPSWLRCCSRWDGIARRPSNTASSWSCARNTSVWWLGLGISQDALGQGAAALESYRQARLGGNLSDTVDDYAESRIAALQQP